MKFPASVLASVFLFVAETTAALSLSSTLPLGRGPHVAGADVAFLATALRARAAHASLRTPRPQPRPPARTAAAPAATWAPFQVF
uniref:Kx blood group antigen n=1 Tax=Homo sapiens TaxID=9606 RepID=A0A8D5B3W7_HUMAN|nr:Kx blood group antigen [Homo sapiens]